MFLWASPTSSFEPPISPGLSPAPGLSAASFGRLFSGHLPSLEAAILLKGLARRRPGITSKLQNFPHRSPGKAAALALLLSRRPHRVTRPGAQERPAPGSVSSAAASHFLPLHLLTSASRALASVAAAPQLPGALPFPLSP